MSIMAARANLVSAFIILLSVVEGRSSVSAALAASFRFVHSNGLHLLHRKRGRISYRNRSLERGGSWGPTMQSKSGAWLNWSVSVKLALEMFIGKIFGT